MKSAAGQAGTTSIVCDNPTDRAKDDAIPGYASGICGCSDDGNTITP